MLSSTRPATSATTFLPRLQTWFLVMLGFRSSCGTARAPTSSLCEIRSSSNSWTRRVESKESGYRICRSSRRLRLKRAACGTGGMLSGTACSRNGTADIGFRASASNRQLSCFPTLSVVGRIFAHGSGSYHTQPSTTHASTANLLRMRQRCSRPTVSTVQSRAGLSAGLWPWCAENSEACAERSNLIRPV